MSRIHIATSLPCCSFRHLAPSYGIVSNNHGISGLLLAALIWQLLLVEWHGSTPGRALMIGAALGLLVAIELLPVVSFLPLTLIYLAVRRDLPARHWMLFALAAGAADPC